MLAHARCCTEVVHISYTMCTRGLPDIYTLSPWACGPRASGVYIRQTTRAHDITTKYTFEYRVRLPVLEQGARIRKRLYIYINHSNSQASYSYI